MSILEKQVDALMRLCTAEKESDRVLAREEVRRLLENRKVCRASSDPEYLIRELLLELGAPDHLVGHPHTVQAILLVVQDRTYIDSITNRNPLCYMTNCVHPSIVYEALSQTFNENETVRNRFRGIQANTSPLSYAELDGCEDLKCTEPELLAQEIKKLSRKGRFTIFGGCCGPDCRHMEALAKEIIL